MFDLTTRDIKYLQGVGPQRATLLNKELDIHSLHDLLYYFPYKYVDRSRLYYIHEIDGNMPYIQLKGQILSFETVGEGRQRRLVAHFSDGTGVIDLVWFQGIKYLMGRYKAHEEYIVFGKPTVFNGRVNIAHPDIDPAKDLFHPRQFPAANDLHAGFIAQIILPFVGLCEGIDRPARDLRKLAARKLRRLSVKKRANLNKLRDALRPLSHLLLRKLCLATKIFKREDYIFVNGKVRIKRIILEHHTDAAVLRFKAGNVVLAKANFTLCRLYKAAD